MLQNKKLQYKKYLIACCVLCLYAMPLFANDILDNVIQHTTIQQVQKKYRQFIHKKFETIKQRKSGKRYELLRIDTKKIAKPLREVERYKVTLFDNKSYRLHFTKIKKHSETFFTYIGEVEGYEGSLVIFTIHDGILTGNFTLPTGSIQILYVSKDYYALKELDHSQLKAFNDGVPPLEIKNTQQQKPESTKTKLQSQKQELSYGASLAPQQGVLAPIAKSKVDDNGNTVDLLVVYTPLALAQSGGDIYGEIESAVEYMNTALKNSDTGVQMRLVGIRLVQYVEEGHSTVDLDRLRGDSDGYLDSIHALRNELGADVVSMIVSTMDGGIAGLGEICTDGKNKNCGFSVVLREWIHTTLAHEVGHNFGLNHDCYMVFKDVSGNPIKSKDCGGSNVTERNGKYNFGYSSYDKGDPSNAQGHNWYTIMAYYNECTAMGVYCPEYPGYSDPTTQFPNSTANRGIANVSDNTRSIRENKFDIAQHRTAKQEVDLLGPKSKTGCFIATAAYDSYLNPHLVTLRNFRDSFLLSFNLGKQFVNFYYSVSPPIALYIRKHEILRFVVRVVLTPFVLVLEHTISFIILLSLFLLFLVYSVFLHKKTIV